MEQNKLKKSFGLKMAIIIVISSIVGSGVFKKVAPMSEVLGSPLLVILSFALAGLLTLFGMLSIAELGSLFPNSGGPLTWLEKMYGKTVSFLYGWASFTVIQTAAISSIAFVFAGAFGTFFTLPHLPEQYASFSVLGIQPLANFGAKFISCVLIIVLSIANVRGAKLGGGISMVFTIIIIVSIAAILTVAFGSNTGNIENLNNNSSSITTAENIGLLGILSAVIIAMRHAFWAYEGWMAIGFIGDELKDPKKDTAKAVTIGLFVIATVYIIINSSYLYVMPINDLIAETTADENKIAAVLVVDRIFGSGGAQLISLMILISTFGCTNATILVSSRIYYAMANRGLFFKKVGTIHSKYKTPDKSLILQCVWACILVFSGSFDLLTDLVVIVAFLFYGLIVFGVIILRKKENDLERPYKTLGYPFVPIIFTVFCIILLAVTFVESPEKSITGLLLVFSGLPFYFFWKKKMKNSETIIEN